MKFMEAVQAMKEGKRITRESKVKGYSLYMPYYKESQKNTNDCIYCDIGEDTDIPNKLSVSDIEATDWELHDKDKDWNLADNKSGYANPPTKWVFGSTDVKKCRDLILEDLNKFPKTFTITGCYGAATESAYKVGFNKAKDIINKRFGDL